MLNRPDDVERRDTRVSIQAEPRSRLRSTSRLGQQERVLEFKFMTEKPQDEKYIKAIKVQKDGKPCVGYEERKKYVHDPNTISKSFIVIESYSKKAPRTSISQPTRTSDRNVPKIPSNKKIPEQDNSKRKEKLLSLINKYGITDSLLEAITEMKGGQIPGKPSNREVPKNNYNDVDINIRPASNTNKPSSLRDNPNNTLTDNPKAPMGNILENTTDTKIASLDSTIKSRNRPPAPNDKSRNRNPTPKNGRTNTAYVPGNPQDKHYCHRNCTCPEDEFRKDNEKIKSERQQRQTTMRRTNSLSRLNNTLYDRNPHYYLEVMNRIERSSSPSRPQALSVRSPSPLRAQTTTLTNTGRRMLCFEIDTGRRSLSRMDEVKMARNCQFCDFCNKHFHEDCFNKNMGMNGRMK